VELAPIRISLLSITVAVAGRRTYEVLGMRQSASGEFKKSVIHYAVHISIQFCQLSCNRAIV
jgi:hypothetical protein